MSPMLKRLSNLMSPVLFIVAVVLIGYALLNGVVVVDSLSGRSSPAPPPTGYVCPSCRDTKIIEDGQPAFCWRCRRFLSDEDTLARWQERNYLKVTPQE